MTKFEKLMSLSEYWRNVCKSSVGIKRRGYLIVSEYFKKQAEKLTLTEASEIVS